MTKKRTIQILRGTTAQNEAYTGSAGELTMDTTLNQLRLHDGTTVGGKVIEGGYHPDLFTWQWADHELNDVQWLRANTFSWQSGAVYEAAYNHLADEAIGETLLTLTTSEGTYTRYADGDVEGASYPYCWKRADSAVGYTLYPNAGGVAPVLYEYPDGHGTIWMITSTGTTISNEYTETIAGVTITYYLADDGHKIVLADQESNVTAIYNATGVAWYYIIDTVNTRFKLPRTKHNKYANSLGVIGNGMTLGMTNGTTDFGISLASPGSETLKSLRANTTVYGSNVSTTTTGTTTTTGIVGITTDPEKSGMVAQQTQDTDQYKYLYFYVGEFTQTAIENTAGLNAELFNGKADVSTVAHVVTEFQAPTAGNNYTWYRKYADGWVEQGGETTTDGATQTVNLPIEMSNTSYAVLITMQYDSTSPLYSRNIGTRTTTSFTAKCNNTRPFVWEVKGMAA